jgi:uncharacterized protein YkwD
MNAVAALTHLLIPQDSNSHRARLLQLPIIVLLLFTFVLSQYGVHTVQEPQILGFASQISTTEVIRLTNIKRNENGLSTLKENSELDVAAKAKGQDMLSKGYWAHVSPDGTQPWDFFKAVGYKYRYAGENLARDFSNPDAAVEAWMASPSHRENMLSDRYKEIGVAVVDGNLNGKDTTIIVQLFGTTLAGSPQVPVAAAQNQTVKSAATETKPVVTSIATPAPEPLEKLTPAVATPIQSDYAKILSFGVVGFIFFALVIDAGVMWYKGLARKGSKSFAQIAFFGLILGLIVAAKVGQII